MTQRCARTLSQLPWLLLVAAPTTAGATVVVVEELQTRSLALSPQVRELLSEFVTARAAALPGLRVIPRPDVLAALRELKLQAVASCVDGSCPVELGRELAASRVLVPEVIGMGATCVATLTVYDVKTATSEAAAMRRGGCDEAALAHSLSSALEDLGRRLHPRVPGPATRAAGARLVSVYFSSRPINAPLFLDGALQAETPLRLDLSAGRSYRVQIKGRLPYGTFETTVVAKDWLQVRAKLELEAIDPRERATTLEWASLGLGGGLALDGQRPSGFAFLFRVATLKWRHFFWTVGDSSVVIASGEDGTLSIGSRAAVPFHLGSSGKHQLLLGCGLHYASHQRSEDSRSLFSLSPGVEYTFVASNGTAFIGGEARAVLPVAGELTGMARPYQLLLVLRAGFSISPVLRRARREARW